jgi:hypothetical protein
MPRVAVRTNATRIFCANSKRKSPRRAASTAAVRRKHWRGV